MRDLLIETYFQARPTLPRKLRVAVRRFLAKRSMRLSSASWPINPLAGAVPDWWSGWPNQKKFAFVLTHDVEGQKGLERCRDLANLEMRLGFRSSFNFVPEGEYETPSSLRDFLTTDGFEVGVHDLCHDGKLYSSRQDFKNRAQKINRYLKEWGSVGFRSAFMLHNFEWLRDLNVLYDASSFDTDPFEPQPEGVNTVFPLWVNRATGGGYVELPYTLPQDSTLFLLLRQAGIETWIKKLDWVAQQGGMALVNVHPDYMNFDGVVHSSQYKAQLYESFLQYVNERYRDEAWFALPRDVARYVLDERAILALKEEESSPTSRVTFTVDQSQQLAPARQSNAEPTSERVIASTDWQLCGKRAAMVTFSFYPGDPRPRRAAEALVSKGLSVDFICLVENSTDSRHEVLNGINVRRIPIKRRRGSAITYVYQYSAFLAISSMIIAARFFTRGYDLVYVHNMPDFMVLSGLIPKLFGAKVILDLHDPMPELMTTIFGFKPEAWPVRLLKFLERFSIAIADSVVTVNRACAKLFTSRSCPDKKMKVVMNSPDERIFQLRSPRVLNSEFRSEDKSFVIMYHGSIVERNGLDVAVNALAQARKTIPNAELRIYGTSTPFLDQVLSSIRNTNLEKSVQYLGPKTLEQLVGAIEECDLGIIPNRKSVFTQLNTPTRIFEYLAVGKPVIVPRASGIQDYFSDDSVLFFELGNAADLADKIKYVFAHPIEVAHVVRRGQEIYQQHRWSKEKSRLVSVAAELLTKPLQIDSVKFVPESLKYTS
jgi:glycosyltransferase involved in cell wall biosynthesis